MRSAPCISAIYRSFVRLRNWRSICGTIASISNGPIFIIGDIRQGGPDYVERFLYHASGINVPVIVELFWPATRGFIQRLARAFPAFALEVSPESHDPVVRRAYGKSYHNDEIEGTLAAALDAGARRVDVFFMIGLPEQTYDSVMETAAYADTLLDAYGADRRLRPFIGPMAPFVDPGSLAFEHPQTYGYRIFYRTLEEHRRALLEPSWQFTLNYETRWMSRAEIVRSSYDGGLRFCDAKFRHGLIDARTAQQVQSALNEGKRLAAEIEGLHNAGKPIDALRPRINALNNTRVLEVSDELRLPQTRPPFKWRRLLRMLVGAWIAHQRRRVTGRARVA